MEPSQAVTVRFGIMFLLHAIVSPNYHLLVYSAELKNFIPFRLIPNTYTDIYVSSIIHSPLPLIRFS